MKLLKLLALAPLALSACAALATDAVSNLQAGTDVEGKTVGGTFSYSGTLSGSGTLGISVPAKITKAAGTLVAHDDLSNLAPGLGASGGIILTGTGSNGNSVSWAVTAPALTGQTINITISGTTYQFFVTSVSGTIVTGVRTLSYPLLDASVGTTLRTVAVVPAATEGGFTVTGTVFGQPVAINIKPQLSAIGGGLPANFVTGITVDNNKIASTAQVAGHFTLNQPAGAGGQTVTFTTAGAVSSTVSTLVPAGQATGNFTLTGGSVTGIENASVLATANGFVKTFNFYVVPQLAAVSGPNTLNGGVVAIFAVYLNSVAPAGGLVVTLHSDDPNIVLPATVTIPAGKTSVYFNVYTAYNAGASAEHIVIWANSNNTTVGIPVSVS
jgi:hypothetical protein